MAHSHNYWPLKRRRQLPALPNKNETSCECTDYCQVIKGYNTTDQNINFYTPVSFETGLRKAQCDCPAQCSEWVHQD